MAAYRAWNANRQQGLQQQFPRDHCMTAYLAFPSPALLRSNSEQFVAAIEAKTSASQVTIMTNIMNDFTDEILKVFFIDMVGLMKLSSFMERVVLGSVGTIKKTVHSVSGTVIKKLDNQQMIPLANYMRSVMLNAPGVSGADSPYVGFPLKDDVHARLVAVMAKMRAGDAKAHAQEFCGVMIEITDLAVEHYLNMPIKLLSLGLILRKLSEGGMSVIQGATHMVIRKLTPDLESAQLLIVAEYLEKMIIIDPKLHK
jgi:hypothetical protein